MRLFLGEDVILLTSDLFKLEPRLFSLCFCTHFLFTCMKRVCLKSVERYHVFKVFYIGNFISPRNPSEILFRFYFGLIKCCFAIVQKAAPIFFNKMAEFSSPPNFAYVIQFYFKIAHFQGCICWGKIGTHCCTRDLVKVFVVKSAVVIFENQFYTF